MTYIKRGIQKHIEDTLFKGKIIIIYGPRQVGKTTMVRDIIRDIDGSAYYSCDDPDIRAKLEYKNTKDLALFAINTKLLVLDEAQLVQDIGITLKVLHDTNPDLQIIATGSSSFELANKTREPLTGRSLEFILPPLSLREVAAHEGPVVAGQMIDTMLTFGMYPGILYSTLNKKELLGTLTTQYLYKDLLSFEGLRKPRLLESLLKVLAGQVGSEVSIESLSNQLDVNRATIETYIGYLEQAFVIYRVDAFEANVRKQVRKRQKIYFYDVGVRNALLGMFGDVKTRVDKGALWENFVITEKRKQIHSKHDVFAGQYFFRTYDGQEVDLIMKTADSSISAYEIKYKKPKTYRIPNSWAKEYPDTKVVVVSRENVLGICA